MQGGALKEDRSILKSSGKEQTRGDKGGDKENKLEHVIVILAHLSSYHYREDFQTELYHLSLIDR